MLGMFLLGLGVVVFFLTYQKRIQQQHKEHMAKEAAYQQELLRANLLSQERERGRIGKDLHDSVGALLTTARLYFRQMKVDAQADDFDALKGKVMEIMDETMTTVRRVSHDLKPVVLERLGLAEALADLADKVNQSGTLKVHYEAKDGLDMDAEFQLNWYRILQELTQNTIKHAQANQIWIKLSLEGDKFLLSFEDDGVGLPADASLESGLGMKNIESRLQLMSGSFTLETKKNRGLVLQLNSRLKP